MSDFASFPEDSFLRVFHAPRRLNADECGRVRAALETFMANWASHEAPVTGNYEILDDQFIAVAANEAGAKISGCSKDSLVGLFRELSAELGLDLVHSPPICFRAEDGVRVVDRKTFGELVKAGQVQPETPVFDMTISTVGPFADGRFELPAKDCWHARAYRELSVAE